MRLEGQNTRVTSRSLACPPRRRHFHGDDGAIMAEAALITPFFILILFGIIEFGGAFRDYQTLSNGASQGTRTAAIQGNATGADWSILQAVDQGRQRRSLEPDHAHRGLPRLGDQPHGARRLQDRLRRQHGDRLGVQRLHRRQPGHRHRRRHRPDGVGRRPAAVRLEPDRVLPLGHPQGPSAAGHRWSADYVGVYVEVLHPWVTGLFGKNITLSDTSVTQLEPQKV